MVLRQVAAGRGRLELEQAIRGLPPHPHALAPVVHVEVSGRLLLATRHAPGGGLDRLLASGPALSAGEVATVAASVGRALVAVHAAGMTHGQVDAGAVVLDGQGRPLLDVTAMVAHPPSQCRVVDDVTALGRLLRHALAGSAPAPLVGALSAAAGGGIDTAAELVRRVLAAAAPEPLRPAGADRPQRRGRSAGLRSDVGRGGRARPGRWWPIVAAVAAVAVVGGGWLLWRHPLAAALGAGPGPVSAAKDAADGGEAVATAPGLSGRGPTAGTAEQIVNWALVLADLDARRAEAFSAADPAALTDVDTAGSTLLASDQAALARLVAAGVRASGFREQLRSVRAVAVSATAVALDVVDVRPSYQLVRASDGVVVGWWPPRGPAAWRVELVLAAGGWQVSAVRSL